MLSSLRPPSDVFQDSAGVAVQTRTFGAIAGHAVAWWRCRVGGSHAAASCRGPSAADLVHRRSSTSHAPLRSHGVILDPNLEERTIAPSLDTFLNVRQKDGGTVEKVDIWGKRRLAYEIDKHAEGIYAVIDVQAEPASVLELDRQLNLNESVLRTRSCGRKRGR